MKTPHKHAELIKAWADGAEIQFVNIHNVWADTDDPTWVNGGQYRLKPAEPVEMYRWLYCRGETINVTPLHYATEFDAMKYVNQLQVDWIVPIEQTKIVKEQQ